MTADFLPASDFGLETLARLYTRTFEGYVYKAVITPEQLASFIEIEDLDLRLSPVLRAGDDLMAFATVGLRGRHAYCRGFGVIPEYRGKGLANALCDEMTLQARKAGARDMTLGVLIDNVGAVKTYERGGFRPTRELHSLQWTANHPPPPRDVRVLETEPRRVLQHFDSLHAVPAVWNRDLPSLSKMPNLNARAVFEVAVPTAYLLFRQDGPTTEIVDLGWTHADGALALVRALQADNTSPEIVCFNEPNDSPSLEIFSACGFAVTHRRYEMRVEFPR